MSVRRSRAIAATASSSSSSTNPPVTHIEALEARRLLAIDTFTVALQALNADYGSTATGSATLTLNTDDPNAPTLRVQLDATGLQDLSAIPGAVHVAHIHGQFDGNAARPLLDQGDGTFFDGTGGTPVNSLVPTAAEDGALNVDEVTTGLDDQLYLDYFEGQPDYGPALLNLASQQLTAPAEGVPPLTNLFDLATGGQINPADVFPSGTTFNLDTTYTFDLSNADQARQYNNLVGPNGDQLDQRTIVINGLTIPTAISDAIDTATNTAAGSPAAGVPVDGGTTSFRVLAPVAAGEIVADDEPDNGTDPASGVFQAVGDPGQEQVPLQANWTFREALFDNEVGFFFTDADGSVNGLQPGDDGYAQAALTSSTRQVLFESGSGAGASFNATVPADQHIVFYIVQDGSTEDFLNDSPSQNLPSGPNAFFSTSAANPDGGAEHVQVSDAGEGLTEFRWEDLTNLGDADFNDVVFTINVAAAADNGPTPTEPPTDGGAVPLSSNVFATSRQIDIDDEDEEEEEEDVRQ